MGWFTGGKRMQFLENYIPTSKVQLKRVCLAYHKGDTKKAQEMFDYYAKDLNLPDFDAQPPTLMEQLKSGASDVATFIKQNKDDILQGYGILQYIIRNNGELPPIEPQPPTEELPPINQ